MTPLAAAARLLPGGRPGRGARNRRGTGLARAQSIRFQIFVAFVAMSAITAALGVFSIASSDREGELVTLTYDRSLMAISYARAASADFNAILAAFARRHAVGRSPPSQPAGAATTSDLTASRQAMLEDLSIAVERSQSRRAARAGERTQQALAAWFAAQDRMRRGAGEADWAALDREAGIISAQLDLLVNYTAGDGFAYRQAARAWNRTERRFTIAATLIALAASGLIALFLARYVTGPIRHASHVAGRIAGGDLDAPVPTGRSDEFGDLLLGMERMRRAIKTGMDNERALRQSAQMQLADAIEHSTEGVVVVDARARVVLANAQAGELLRSLTNDPSSVVAVGADASFLVRELGEGAEATGVSEFECADGRWLRVSRNAAADGGSVVMCSDVSLLKQQQAALNAANFWLDAALANLSHGLCLFGADGRLKVFNGRFGQILALGGGGPRTGMTLDELLALGDGAPRSSFA